MHICFYPKVLWVNAADYIMLEIDVRAKIGSVSEGRLYTY